MKFLRHFWNSNCIFWFILRIHEYPELIQFIACRLHTSQQTLVLQIISLPYVYCVWFNLITTFIRRKIWKNRKSIFNYYNFGIKHKILWEFSSEQRDCIRWSDYLEKERKNCFLVYKKPRYHRHLEKSM